jgi:hypothetical protein
MKKKRYDSLPGHIVRAADKEAARLNVIRDLLNRLHYDGKDGRLIALDARVVLEFEESCIGDGRLAK